MLFFTAGCGYYNPYVAAKDSKAISVYVTMWTNQTNELGLETTFYHSLLDWLRKSELIKITDSASEADYLITGKITGVDYPEISYGSNHIANELRANLTSNSVIKENTTDKIIRNNTATSTETLLTDNNPMRLQSNKKAA